MALVTDQMWVEKYHPKKLYGFVQDDAGKQAFFHVRSFHWGDFPTYPPPIVGERVEVEYDPETRSSDQAAKARRVARLAEPVSLSGFVEDFNPEHGWGFIRSSDGRSHYLHRSEMTDGRLPMPGTEVTFYEGFRKGRTRACYVKIKDS